MPLASPHAGLASDCMSFMNEILNWQNCFHADASKEVIKLVKNSVDNTVIPFCSQAPKKKVEEGVKAICNIIENLDTDLFEAEVPRALQ